MEQTLEPGTEPQREELCLISRLASGRLANNLYKYDPLQTSTSIRLLELDPGQSEDVLICHLRTVEIDNAPPYEAISYVWGNQSAEVRVVCEGKLLWITPNLKDILRRVRMQEERRLLWADAICIDQENLQEKSQQVWMMRKIFSSARRVLVWLGHNTDNNTLALPLIQRIGQLYCEHNSITVQDLHIGDFRSLREFELDKLSYDAAAWDSFFQFYGLPYFTRTWCIREINSSRESLAMYGREEIDFDLIALAARFPSYEPSKFRILQHMDDDKGIGHASIMRRRAPNRLTLRGVLEITCGFLCSDTRDKIYSTLDFSAPDEGGTWVFPDYTKPAVQVFLETAKLMLKEDGLQLLSHVLHNSHWLSDYPVSDNWPSWVPRWEHNFFLPFSRVPHFDASLGLEPSNYVVVDSLLKLQGLYIDTVSNVEEALQWSLFDFSSPSDGQASFTKMWRKYARGEKSATTYPTGETFRTAFACTMCGGYIENLNYFEAYTDKLLSFADTEMAHTTEDVAPIYEHHENQYHPNVDPYGYQLLAQQVGIARQVFNTLKGYLGIGPNIQQPNDQIWVLLGAKSPFLLRPKGDYFLVVGECYVHGFMKGEAIKEMNEGRLMVKDIVLC